ncbi:hypothetical protein K502DRAFT_331350 [Neoconidiobolus thromboides FSU 785]|nr:hypothetical protein K502DRAFT_331350 [Neoconidiobolus thromboides FSU 785]
MSEVKIPLYTAASLIFILGTPNGHKSLKISPNGHIPAIVDHTNNDFSVFESGAILLYLADKYGPEYKLLLEDNKSKSEAIKWVLETHLQGKSYLIGKTLTVSDISSFPWVRYTPWAGVELYNFLNINSWLDK